MLDVVIVKKIAKPLLLVSVMKQVLAGKVKDAGQSLDAPVIYFQTDALKIENLGRAPMHIDGEPVESPQQLSIKVLPRHFNLLQAGPKADADSTP